MPSIGEIAAQLNKLVFTILLIGHEKTAPTWRHDLRVIRHHSFWLIIGGKGIVSINGIRYPAEPGKIFFFLPGMMVERETDPSNPFKYCFVRFHYNETYYEKEQWITRSAEQVPFPIEGMHTLQNAPQVIYQTEQLCQLWQKRGHITALRRKTLFQELILTLLQDFRAQEIAGNATAAIEHTQDYMATHYQEPLALEALAQMAGLSVSHYSRLFKKVIGYSPIDYLTHLRIDRAKELLALSDYRLKSVACSVGYTDEFYFSRIFKKIEGVSPRDYAKKHRVSLVNPIID